MDHLKKQGVILVNLGTPTTASTTAVKTFLSEFLHDRRVVDTHRCIWYPLLHGVILPRRAAKVAKLYQAIWMDNGSPLMVYSQQQAAKLSQKIGMNVEIAMTYGEPSIQQALQRLAAAAVEEITILPLYPQYSTTTTAAVSDALARALQHLTVIPHYRFINNYHDHPLYIKALAEKVRSSWHQHGQGDYLLCSYHGIPQRFANNGDIYPQHCEKTTQLLALELGLTAEQIGMSYQSRFGREEWLKPYTDHLIEQLPKQGVKKLQIITPAFSVDCLETLEEVALQYKTLFLQSGGEQYQFIECLNDSDAHIAMMASLIRE